MALDLIRQAIQRDGDNASYYTSCGLALQCLKRPDEAVVVYNQALALKPDFAD
jgi:Flp pilus assembly protein TadD